MKFELIEGWEHSWHRLWSNRLAALAAALEFFNQIFSAMVGILPWCWVSWAAGVCAVGAFIARHIKQPELRRRIEDATWAKQ